jgi:hypothetical protein
VSAATGGLADLAGNARSGGDNMTTLQSITPSTGYTNRLPANFKITGQALAAAIGDLLASGEFSGRASADLWL